MTSIKDDYLNYLSKFGQQEKRSMFGGTGIFINSAMFAIVTPTSMYIRGGNELDEKLIKSGCEKFRHIKKSKTATVNYYEIKTLFLTDQSQCDSFVEESIAFSCRDKNFRSSESNRRLRDLPNMRLTLERMVKKAGVLDVDTFFNAGAVNVFRRVCEHNGQELDHKLLWIFAGAIHGGHWQLLSEDHKRRLLDEYRQQTH
ncbi:TfoX/Sxy family DNA transformation protein [Photobacterium piscicola]|uniref:TfoX/Sxy family DNA transformation protein n=1 Tax=Photobacterium piscicola TaxID=1378299 RepID=A0ABU6LFC6_9GAMM|nr:TfoX/Sxy family DNA transformation protein [Photobacterium piscicola]MEC6882515.1 TfoX/Sxy family DNA transformation protein [Photobacterium piscicola]MEC6898058.1 TfoX/Sxy family DNA transformation protein [Photobacterium piscicola]